MALEFEVYLCHENLIINIHMISVDKYKKVVIEITAYRQDSSYNNSKEMNKEKTHKNHNKDNKGNKFICAICLNSPNCDGNDDHKYTKKHLPCSNCPICKKTEPSKVKKTKLSKDRQNNEEDNKEPKHHTINEINTLATSQTDVALGLNLLNEVLTVFKSNKKVETETESQKKTVVLKDASVITDHYTKSDVRPTLTVSKMFIFSIEEETASANGKFTIVNSTEPEKGHKSDHRIDLTKQKSSSIPQIKLDQFKNSLKDKTKSKDAIEEVNRMFATVKKNYPKQSASDDKNRPYVRSGPRVLPVVKTRKETEPAYKSDDNSESRDSRHHEQCCQFCQTNYLMSSGDSQEKDNCCHRRTKHWNSKACSSCVHTLCCHQENDRHICRTCQDSMRNSHRSSESGNF